MAIGELFGKITDFYRNRYTELAGFQNRIGFPTDLRSFIILRKYLIMCMRDTALTESR